MEKIQNMHTQKISNHQNGQPCVKLLVPTFVIILNLTFICSTTFIPTYIW